MTKVGGNISCLNPLDFDWLAPASTMPGVEILVDGMTDGLSAVNLVQYGTITGSSHSFLFTERPFGNGTPPPDTQLLSGSGAKRHVATTLRRDNGIGGFHDTTFAYQGVGLKSTRHWGFIGFYAGRAVDQQSGVVSYTQYRVDFPHFGKPARVYEYDGIYPSYSTVVSRRIHDYTQHLIAHSQGTTTYPSVSGVAELHFEGTTLLGAGQQQHSLTFANGFIDKFVSTTQTGTNVTTNPDQSTWGDVSPISLTGILGTAEKTVDFANRTTGGQWLIGFAESLRTETWKGPPSGSGIVQEVAMTPHPTSLDIDDVTRYPSHATLTLVRDYSYDSQGRRISTTISGDNVQSRTTTVNTFLHDRYPKHTTNDLGHNVNFSNYDTRFGTVEVRGNPNGRSKSWIRDPFGRVVSRTNADGVVTAMTYTACSGSCPAVYGISPAFKVQTTTTHAGVSLAPVQNAYYDLLGREIRAEVKSFDGSQFSKRDTKYDALGRVEKQSLPYFAGTLHDVVRTYDIKDRIKSETRPDGGSTVIDYSVNGNQWVVTTTEHIKASDGSSDGTQARRQEYNILRLRT